MRKREWENEEKLKENEKEMREKEKSIGRTSDRNSNGERDKQGM